MRNRFNVMSLLVLSILAGCSGKPESEAVTSAISTEEMQSIARDAYVYGFPLMMNLKVFYEYSVDTNNANYKAPINEIWCEARVFTPADTSIVTPNSDTPYCMFWMDLRNEPLVMTVPSIEAGRYYGVQLVDLYTHNFAYVGTRTNSNDAGSYLLAGPDWDGETPDGISEVLASETDITFSIIRTQLHGPDDIGRVAEIQSQYSLQTLSNFLGQPSPEPMAPIAVPEWVAGAEFTVAAFDYIDAAMRLTETHPDEADMMARFAEIGLGAADDFSTDTLDPDVNASLEAGVQQGIADAQALLAEFSSDPLGSAKIFGTREFLVSAAPELNQPNFYLPRTVAAMTGLYGNSGAEAVYPSYFVDSEGLPLDAAANDYVMTFDADHLPPVKAFWSLSMYDGATQLFIDNPLDRYLVNSSMMDDFVLGNDGSLTIYIGKESPDDGLESNWLPAPDGPFYMVLRLYLPEQRVLDGEWSPPLASKAN